MSSYTGLYVQRLSNGTIHNVQVVDSAGHSIPLDPQVYVDRQIQPPLEHLPDIDNYVPVSAISPVILALAEWVKRVPVTEDAIYRMQNFGFIFPDTAGQMKLTPYGERTLREHKLL